eukprot:TRINITY_DN1888_c0_g1_i2.p2 TRINITY_DN1888_c0_g1~~TRINITY_DN1888_c0_g1_i2.p2  ORF type:complete len:214 (+),score=-8.10 TRINITY_DN1888_c0_g1_i2:651-1292(+)
MRQMLVHTRLSATNYTLLMYNKKFSIQKQKFLMKFQRKLNPFASLLCVYTRLSATNYTLFLQVYYVCIQDYLQQTILCVTVSTLPCSIKATKKVSIQKQNTLMKFHRKLNPFASLLYAYTRLSITNYTLLFVINFAVTNPYCIIVTFCTIPYLTVPKSREQLEMTKYRQNTENIQFSSLLKKITPQIRNTTNYSHQKYQIIIQLQIHLIYHII